MNRFITIPISHFCEKVRWALDLSGLPYQEEGHMPMLHWRATYGVGGRRTAPVLVLDSGPVLSDSTDALSELSRRAPGMGLYGDTPEQRAEILAWEERFDRKLGPSTRRWAYHYLLRDKPLLFSIFHHGVPRGEVSVFSAIFPLAAILMRRAMAVNQAGYERSLARVAECFQAVEDALADGRPYLMGDRFSAADLTFAALSSIIVAPDTLPVPLPPLDAYPAAMAAEITRHRETVAGRFALRLYANDRPRRPPVSLLRSLPG